eukprot:182623-Chlamydomonas_euryale.AAC.1
MREARAGMPRQHVHRGTPADSVARRNGADRAGASTVACGGHTARGAIGRARRCRQATTRQASTLVVRSACCDAAAGVRRARIRIRVRARVRARIGALPACAQHAGARVGMLVPLHDDVDAVRSKEALKIGLQALHVVEVADRRRAP